MKFEEGGLWKGGEPGIVIHRSVWKNLQGKGTSPLITVSERTVEIGTMRALGMRRAKVLALILGTAGTAGALSAGLGALLPGR